MDVSYTCLEPKMDLCFDRKKTMFWLQKRGQSGSRYSSYISSRSVCGVDIFFSHPSPRTRVGATVFRLGKRPPKWAENQDMAKMCIVCM